MSKPSKGTHSSAVHKRVKGSHHSRESYKMHQQSSTTNIHVPPPPPVEPHFDPPIFQSHFNFGNSEVRNRVDWPPVKSEPSPLHGPTHIEPGSLGSAQQPIRIDIPPSLEDIKRETLPSTQRSNYVRHSEMTVTEAKERRRKQNRASARRTRQRTRHHITVLESGYRDLRKKYTKLRSLYLNVAGPNAYKTLPTFQDFIRQMNFDADDNDEEEQKIAAQVKTEQRMETNAAAKELKKLRKKLIALSGTVQEQLEEIQDLKQQLKHERATNGQLQTRLLEVSCQLSRDDAAQSFLGHPAVTEEMKPIVNQLGATPPIVSPPISVPQDLNVSPVKDGDIDMAPPDHIPRLPRLEMGGEPGVISSGPNVPPNDSHLGGAPMPNPQFDLNMPPQLYMNPFPYDFYGGLGVPPSGHYVSSSMPGYPQDTYRHGNGLPSFETASFQNNAYDVNNMPQFGRQ